MAKDTLFLDLKKQKNSAIRITDERLTGQAVLALFEPYVRSGQAEGISPIAPRVIDKEE